MSSVGVRPRIRCAIELSPPAGTGVRCQGRNRLRVRFSTNTPIPHPYIKIPMTDTFIGGNRQHQTGETTQAPPTLVRSEAGSLCSPDPQSQGMTLNALPPLARRGVGITHPRTEHGRMNEPVRWVGCGLSFLFFQAACQTQSRPLEEYHCHPINISATETFIPCHPQHQTEQRRRTRRDGLKYLTDAMTNAFGLRWVRKTKASQSLNPLSLQVGEKPTTPDGEERFQAGSPVGRCGKRPLKLNTDASTGVVRASPSPFSLLIIRNYRQPKPL